MTSEQPVLSIVVAAYNIENTIGCIFDALFQSGVTDSLEVVVVNDGSHDGTSQIAHEYEEQYPRLVRVVDKPNGGHGSALTAGFDMATGLFCRPLDGDDWLDPQGLRKLVRFLADTSADMVICDFEKFNIDTGDSTTFTMELPANTSLTVQDLVSVPRLPNYHGIVFATRILQQIPDLDRHCFYVDNEYDVYPLFQVEKVWYLPETVYVHTVGNAEQSTSNASLVRNEENMRRVFFSLMDYANEHTTSTAAVHITKRYARDLMYMFTRVTFVMNPKEGARLLRAFYAAIAKRYPAFYNENSHQRLPELYKRFHRRGYRLLRFMLKCAGEENKPIIW